MKRYKPEFLGRIIPADNEAQLTDFVKNKYDAFTKIYDVCKEHTDSISDVVRVDSDDNSLSIKIYGDDGVMDKIRASVCDESITIDNNIITACL